jgi:hypothetical protein
MRRNSVCVFYTRVNCFLVLLQLVEKLKKDVTDFEKQKVDELKRLEEFKAEEKKKLR